MPRKPNKTSAPSFEVTPEQTPGISRATVAINELDRMNAETAENAHALAVQFGYEGSLTVGAVEDEIRHYQRRTAEACFELGKRLLILKELTPHGEFKQRLDLLGIEYPAANRFMAISQKFSNVATLQLLKVSGTQSKLLELLVLDDGEIAELGAGETVRGVDLDKIETMSVRELKAALREAHEDAKATDKVLGLASTKNHALEKELEKTKRRISAATPDEVGAELRAEISQLSFNTEASILGALDEGFCRLEEHAIANNCTHEEFMSGCLAQIERALIGLRNRFNVKAEPDGNEIPDWLRPGAEEKAAEQVKKDIAKAGKKVAA